MGGPPASMVLPSGQRVPINVRRHRRSRHFILRVSSGVIQLTIPTTASVREAERWALQQRPFILAELAKEGDAIPLSLGATLPVLGEPCLVVPGLKTTGEWTGGRLAITPVPARSLPARVERALRQRVLEAASGDLEAFWHRLDVPPAPISVRAFRRRWGSCAADGETLINWRLIFAPRSVLKAVCAHEAAHRVEMNHSAAFYAVLDQLMPNRADADRWLRDHGATLYAYGRTTPTADPTN